MTGDLVKAMRHCPQPVIAAVEGVCAGAGAILAMASRPALRRAVGEGRVPLRARRPRRLRHGRLRHPAAHHRPGPRLRAALYRPLDERRGRAAPGASSTGVSDPVLRTCDGNGKRTRRRPDACARDDQEDAAPGMERRRRRGDRDGGAGAGRSACRPRTSTAPTKRSRRSEAGVRRRLTDGPLRALRLAFLRGPRMRELAREAEAWAKENLGHAHGERRRCDLQAAGAGPRLRRLSAPLRVGEARRALDRAAARGVRLPRRARRLLLRHAGPGQRADRARRQRRAEEEVPAARPPPARRSRPSRCPSPMRARTCRR